jgi:hypothetical protein
MPAVTYSVNPGNSYYHKPPPSDDQYRIEQAYLPNSRRGMTRANVKWFYDVLDAGPDYWLLFGIANPGTWPSGTPLPSRPDDEAWCQIVDNAPGQTNQGDFLIQDTSALIANCIVGAVIETIPGPSYPIVIGDTWQIHGRLELSGLTPMNPRLLASLDSDTTILQALARIKISGLTINTSHVEADATSNWIDAANPISWPYPVGTATLSSATSDEVGFALIGYNGTTYKVFDVAAVDKGVVSNGEFCWIDLTNIIRRMHELWTGDANNKIWDFFIIPCTPDYLNAIEDALAGDEGLVRLLPPVSSSISFRGDGTPNRITYSCTAKLVVFTGIEISYLYISFQLGQTTALTLLLPENQWPPLVPGT